MTYLLTDALPHTVDVGGVSYEVTTDFRLFVAFERDAVSYTHLTLPTILRV